MTHYATDTVAKKTRTSSVVAMEEEGEESGSEPDSDSNMSHDPMIKPSKKGVESKTATKGGSGTGKGKGKGKGKAGDAAVKSHQAGSKKGKNKK